MIAGGLDRLRRDYIDGSDPVPAPDAGVIGDGDYRAIGAEFLGHFTELGGLRPGHRVFEIGCGTGRMAMPLRRYLSAQGSYLGMDIVAPAIDWCRRAIAAEDPRFDFRCDDLYHPLYNSTGRQSASTARFPVEDGGADFVIATSVFTHLSRQVFERYLDESARVLAPGGRLFATFFLINEENRQVASAPASRYPFDLSDPGPFYRDPSGGALLAAVAVEEAWLLDRAADSGLTLLRPVAYGFWPSDDPSQGTSYQDICVFSRA